MIIEIPNGGEKLMERISGMHSGMNTTRRMNHKEHISDRSNNISNNSDQSNDVYVSQNFCQLLF